MATPAQITANRANAQKSTGPRTAEGKAASRFNALKHALDAESVIIPGEDPADYDALVHDYHAEFRPLTRSEAFHVDTMIRADWNKRRLQRVEAELYRTVLAESGGANLVSAILSGTPAAKLLTRVQRQIVGFERTWYRAEAALDRSRSAAEFAEQDAFKTFLDRTCPVEPFPQLGSFPVTSRSVGPPPVKPAPLVAPNPLPAANAALTANPALRL
jgi:hypothetical protein